MAIRKFKPTSPSRRFYEAPDFEMITRGKPEKKLLDKKSSKGGRNNNGRITSRFRGGGPARRPATPRAAAPTRRARRARRPTCARGC